METKCPNCATTFKALDGYFPYEVGTTCPACLIAKLVDIETIAYKDDGGKLHIHCANCGDCTECGPCYCEVKDEYE